MTEPEGMTQVREEAIRSKGGKGKAIIKRGQAEASSRQPEGSVRDRSVDRPPVTEATSTRDPQTVARIQQRAYGLFEASGRKHGHDLEHWLEAERQITGSSER